MARTAWQTALVSGGALACVPGPRAAAFRAGPGDCIGSR